MKNGDELTCKKDLYKSTYRSNAFTANQNYKIICIDHNFVFILDNHGHEFNFSLEHEHPYYDVSDYFDIPNS